LIFKIKQKYTARLFSASSSADVKMDLRFFVLRPAAPLRGGPVDIVEWTFDVTGFAVNAISVVHL
jgi:hypothetical protein